jgi:hypothetical protein
MSGADIVLELWAIHDAILGQLGGRKRDNRKHYPMPCHGCGKRTLYREYGQDLIKCTNCPPRSPGGRGWTEEDYDRLAGFTRFHLKVVEEEEMREIDKANQRAAEAEARAVELESQLDRIAKFAGHPDAAALLAVINKADQGRQHG